jgi:LEA14-like dessication related protein
MSRHSIQEFIGAVAATVILVSLTACTQRPTASITGVQMQDVKLTHATMVFAVKVDNPYMSPLPLSNLDYTLSSAGQQFMTGKADVQGSIPAQGSKVLPVPVQINYLELVNTVKDARPGKAIPYKADLGLSVTVPVYGNLRVPMSKEGTLEIPSGPGMLNRLEGLTR